MPSTTFIDQVTPITAAWLNDVNNIVYNQVQNISTLRGCAISGPVVYQVLGYYTAGDGGGGTYYLDPNDHSSNDNGGTVIVANDGGRWKLVVTGAVSAKQFGAYGDGVHNDTTAIQTAINTEQVVTLPAGTYVITVLYLSSGQTLIGEGSQITILKKNGAASGVGSNIMRSGTITDSYVKDAAIIIKHADNAYAYGVNLTGFQIQSVSGTNAYGIYAPRCSNLTMLDVVTVNFLNGFTTYDTWLSSFDRCWHYGSISGAFLGWAWLNDGSNIGAGTTCIFRDCFADGGTGTGWYLYGLKYSNLQGCACDNVIGGAYYFESSQITLTGCGMESLTLSSTGVGIWVNNSQVVMTGFNAYLITGGGASSYYFKAENSGAQVTAINCNLPNFVTVNSAYNRIVQGGAAVVSINSNWPTNGNTFSSYSSGATVTDIINGITTITDANGSGIATIDKSFAVPYSTSMTFDSSIANLFFISPTDGVGFTINAPLNPATNKKITIMIRNTSGGALGTVTWNAVFKHSTWTSPANTQSRCVSFEYDGSNWVQTFMSTVDVPN